MGDIFSYLRQAFPKITLLCVSIMQFGFTRTLQLTIIKKDLVLVLFLYV